MPEPEKPLFIPLKSEYYEQFDKGFKTRELRLYGPRWNERTCRVGRAVTLSKGYGKQNRLHRTVSGFRRRRGFSFDGADRQAIEDTYGRLDVWIATIMIDLDTPHKGQ